ncbi:MAG: response regulator [Gammaproteobacteria bacterium]|nr:response regulator [Gammaproteobacteria bacterium]
MIDLKNSELNQSLIRVTIGLLTYAYISSGISIGYFASETLVLKNFAALFFSYNIIILLSIIAVPESTLRRYIALTLDISSTTFASFLTGGINSVYVMIYLWIYIGYGTRYGKNYLLTAVVLTVTGYNILIISENAWSTLTLDTIAFLLLITALPIYLYNMQKKMLMAVIEADLANKAKNEFLSNMTYQIRTPIGGVVGMIDLLNKTNLDTQQQQYLQALSQSSNSLQEIIEDIVDFSRIEKGKILFNQTSFDAGQLIDSLVTSLAPFAHEKNIEINSYINHSLPAKVISDPQRLRQLLSNLIRYAIDNATQGNVYLHALEEDFNNNYSNCSIEIQYQQAASTPHIYLSDLTESNEALSLRIGSQLTRLMGGTFDIKYSDNDRTTLALRFNCKTEAPHTTPATKYKNKRALVFEPDDINRSIILNYCEQLGMDTYTTNGRDNLIAHIIWGREKNKHFDLIILCETLKNNNAQDLIKRIRLEAKSDAPILYATYIKYIGLTEPGIMNDVQATTTKPIAKQNFLMNIEKLLSYEHAPSTQSKSAKQCHVLIAEDSEINASIIYNYLTDLGHNVDIATDGNTALYAMHKHHYDVVFMDVHMPNLDGIEATRQWRKLESEQISLTYPLPIIAITAKATSEDKNKCIEAGMNGFLTKPVSAKQLADVLDMYAR